MNNISKLNGKMKVLCSLEHEGKSMVFVGGESGVVYAFSKDDHELIDLYDFEEPLLCMASVVIREGYILAFGCISVNIHIR